MNKIYSFTHTYTHIYEHYVPFVGPPSSAEECCCCCCCARSRRAIFSTSPRTPCCRSLPPPLPPNAAAAGVLTFGECMEELDATATGSAGDDGVFAAGSCNEVMRPCGACEGAGAGACLPGLILVGNVNMSRCVVKSAYMDT